MPADVSFLVQIMPVLVFLLVALVTGAILTKIKILGDSLWINLFVALAVASIFVAFAGTREYVGTIVPWFVVVLITLFMILVLTGFVGKGADFMGKGIGIVFVLILGIVFIVSLFFVFSDSIAKYIPGPSYGFGADENILNIADFFLSARVLGAVLLLIVSGLVAWVLVKMK